MFAAAGLRGCRDRDLDVNFDEDSCMSYSIYRGSCMSYSIYRGGDDSLPYS